MADEGTQPADGIRRASALLLTRLTLVAISTVIAWWGLSMKQTGVGFPPTFTFSALGLVVVNIVCLLMTRRFVHAEGGTLRAMIGFRRGRLLGDLGWGVLWVVVLYLPFTATIVLVMWLLNGERMFVAFETVFYDPASVPDLPAAVWLVLAIVIVLTFAPLNGPAEELTYRGYAQSRLSAVSPVIGVLVPAVVFGLQHVFFAPTAQGMIVYAAAFTVWGVGSGLIFDNLQQQYGTRPDHPVKVPVALRLVTKLNASRLSGTIGGDLAHYNS